MGTPYYRVMQHLSLIKGPLVDDWKQEQITTLVGKINDATNPIGRDQEVLWNEYLTAFNDAFTDTTKKQHAQTQLKTLGMKGNDLDTYIANFKRLAKDAGYDLTALGTTDLFALGLQERLFERCMNRETQPETFTEWVDAAKAEITKQARKEAMRESKYQQTGHFSKPRTNGRQKWIHPNDRTVPMDVDQPTYTRVRRAYTEQDKERLRGKGACFYCEQQGHMARDCPKEKRQQSYPGYGQAPSGYGQKSFQSRPGPPHPFKKKIYNQPRPNQGFRKSNKPRSSYPSRVRSAHIEEIDDEGNENEDDYVPSLAARTARLSEDQREQWVAEMQAIGMHF